jgi:hypothetical protein
MIGTSSASFGHQSMSFKKPRKADSIQRSLFSDPDDIGDPTAIKRQFIAAVEAP